MCLFVGSSEVTHKRVRIIILYSNKLHNICIHVLLYYCIWVFVCRKARLLSQKTHERVRIIVLVSHPDPNWLVVQAVQSFHCEVQCNELATVQITHSKKKAKINTLDALSDEIQY